MQTRKKVSWTLIENVVVYVVAFLAIILTPLVAQSTADLFKFVAYNQMNEFIFELLTSLFWIAEICALISTINSRRKKREKRELIRKMLEAGDLDPAIPEGVLLEATLEELSAADSSADGEKSVEKKVGLNNEVKFRGEILPFKNLLILTAIAVVCIFTISAQIDFSVKPFYDLGEKITGYQMWNKIGVIIRNCVKCVWIVVMLVSADAIARELLPQAKQERKYLGWLLTGAILMAYGLYDVLTSGIGFIPTYLAFYVAFTAIFYLTEKHAVKSYFLILLVYIF